MLDIKLDLNISHIFPLYIIIFNKKKLCTIFLVYVREIIKYVDTYHHYSVISDTDIFPFMAVVAVSSQAVSQDSINIWSGEDMKSV